MSAEDRNAAMRDLAYRISALVAGTPLGLAVGGAVLFIGAQREYFDDDAFTVHIAAKLRAVADVLDPPA